MTDEDEKRENRAAYWRGYRDGVRSAGWPAPPFAGGQGRTGEDVVSDGGIAGYLLVIVVGLVFAVGVIGLGDLLGLWAL